MAPPRADGMEARGDRRHRADRTRLPQRSRQLVDLRRPRRPRTERAAPARRFLIPWAYAAVLVAIVIGLQYLFGNLEAGLVVAGTVFACVQAALLLTLTTTIGELLDAFAVIVSPLRRLGVDPGVIALTASLMVRAISHLSGLLAEADRYRPRPWPRDEPQGTGRPRDPPLGQVRAGHRAGARRPRHRRLTFASASRRRGILGHAGRLTCRRGANHDRWHCPARHGLPERHRRRPRRGPHHGPRARSARPRPGDRDPRRVGPGGPAPGVPRTARDLAVPAHRRPRRPQRGQRLDADPRGARPGRRTNRS